MKKIFINTPFSSDASSFWRCIGPMSYLQKQTGCEIQIYLPPMGSQIHWDTLSQFDMVFMHRPCRNQDVILLQMCRLLNIPVWADYDDWLFDLPDWNPHKDAYNRKDVQEATAIMVACADVVSVSTTALLRKMEKVNPQVWLIPNAYQPHLFPYRTSLLPERKDIFVWRGTNTHDGDISSVGEAFTQLKKPVHFLGSATYAVTSKMVPEMVVRVPAVDPILYWKNVYNLAPKVWLFPLKNHFFNHCKSNISWIEAIHAGAICVAPNLPEWKHPGIISYKVDDSNSFLDACNEAMEMDPYDHRKHVDAGYEEIMSLYNIKNVNEIRETIANCLLSHDFQKNNNDPFNRVTAVWALRMFQE